MADYIDLSPRFVPIHNGENKTYIEREHTLLLKYEPSGSQIRLCPVLSLTRRNMPSKAEVEDYIVERAKLKLNFQEEDGLGSFLRFFKPEIVSAFANRDKEKLDGLYDLYKVVNPGFKEGDSYFIMDILGVHDKNKQAFFSGDNETIRKPLSQIGIEIIDGNFSPQESYHASTLECFQDYEWGIVNLVRERVNSPKLVNLVQDCSFLYLDAALFSAINVKIAYEVANGFLNFVNEISEGSKRPIAPNKQNFQSN